MTNTSAAISNLSVFDESKETEQSANSGILRSATYDLEGLVLDSRTSEPHVLLDIEPLSFQDTVGREYERQSQRPGEMNDSSLIGASFIQTTVKPSPYSLQFGSDLLATAREEVLRLDRNDPESTSTKTVPLTEIHEVGAVESPETSLKDTSNGEQHDTVEEKAKPPKIYKPAYYALQAAEDMKKSALRARINELEEENKDYKKRLRYEGVMADENEKLRVEVRRLASFETAVEAAKVEVESLRRSEQLAAEKSSNLQALCKKQEEDWRTEKTSLLYRLEDSAKLLNQGQIEFDKLKHNYDQVLAQDPEGDSQSRVLELQDHLEQLAAEARSKLKKYKEKISSLTAEVNSLKEDNGILIARNVELQKGADTHGPRVYDLRMQLVSLKGRLDKQMEINSDLGRAKQAVEGEFAKLQDEMKNLVSADKIRKLDTERIAFKFCLRESLDALGWELNLNMRKIDERFQKMHQKLFTRVEAFEKRSELAKNFDIADLKETLVRILNGEFNRLKSVAEAEEM